ncbi:hypothetical protein ES705_48715 [subsurface metagenome]
MQGFRLHTGKRHQDIGTVDNLYFADTLGGVCRGVVPVVQVVKLDVESGDGFSQGNVLGFGAGGGYVLLGEYSCSSVFHLSTLLEGC